MFILGSRGLKFLCMQLFAPAIAWSQNAHPALIRMAMIEVRSGPFANTGEAVYRNLLRAAESPTTCKMQRPA